MNVYAHFVIVMLHALFQCSNTIIKLINDKHMKLLTDVTYAIID